MTLSCLTSNVATSQRLRTPFWQSKTSSSLMSVFDHVAASNISKNATSSGVVGMDGNSSSSFGMKRFSKGRSCCPSSFRQSRGVFEVNLCGVA